MKLNLGCGDVAPPGWVNVDYGLGARLRKVPVIGALSGRFLHCDWDPAVVIHDLRTPFPWPSGAADVAYSSHSLEHLTRPAGERFMREVFRVLRPGGIVRIVVPDLRREVERYRAGEVDARDFLHAIGVVDAGERSAATRLYGLLSGQPHRCMYDDASLTALMRSAGFTGQRKAPFDSEIPDIAEIEGEAQTAGALIVEARKPPSGD